MHSKTERKVQSKWGRESPSRKGLVSAPPSKKEKTSSGGDRRMRDEESSEDKGG